MSPTDASSTPPHPLQPLPTSAGDATGPVGDATRPAASGDRAEPAKSDDKPGSGATPRTRSGPYVRPTPPAPRETLAELLALHDAAHGDAVLKESPKVRVTRLPYDAVSDCVVKEHRHPQGLRRLWNSLGGSRARRTRRAVDLLMARGLPAPAWLGLIEDVHRSVAVVRHVPGPTLQAALADADRERQQALAVAAAELAAQLHTRGLAIRDLKPPNLVVTPEDQLVLVDLDDLRPSRAPRYVWRNLAALDAYAQQGPRPLGLAARLAAARAYAHQAGAELRGLLRQVVPRARAKRSLSPADPRP